MMQLLAKEACTTRRCRGFPDDGLVGALNDLELGNARVESWASDPPSSVRGGLEGTTEECKEAVGVVGEGQWRGHLAELLNERKHGLELAEEVEALVVLRPSKLLECTCGALDG